MPQPSETLTVSRLNREARALVERGLGQVYVEGEISNLARPASGHLYFTLKDAFAQVRCALFRARGQALTFRPENGQQVLARVRVSLYEARGEFQLIVEALEPSGDGALRQAFEALKQRLNAEGLFAEGLKHPLPTLPDRIGVITSPSGAALHDILHVLGRRFPAIPVLVYPVPVQGEGAGERIAAAITLANQRAECDVLLLARGGGSLEDLWAFNEEVVARAIRASRLPVVSGVGHEIDFTIADLAADHRAPTPSAAAEVLSPDQDEWRQTIDGLRRRLERRLSARLLGHRQRLQDLEARLLTQQPQRRILDRTQHLDELDMRLGRAIQRTLGEKRRRLTQVQQRLELQSPARRLPLLRARLSSLEPRLRQAMTQHLQQGNQRLATLARALETVSPLATLSRGYAIVTHQGTLVREAAQVSPGDRLEIRLHQGKLNSVVDAAPPDSPSR